MPGTYKTEAVVLRSIRYGEADRVLHLYTADRGRVGAVAKGVRRVRSRLGGRLEPLSRVKLVLYEGRGELSTISQVDTRARPPGPARAPRLARARLARPARRCCACSTPPSPTARPTTCSATSWRFSTRIRPRPPAAQALAFRVKLLLAAGFAPELSSCAACGEAEHLGGFSPSAGGVVCAGCEAGSFPLSEEAHGFLVAALARPLSDVPEAAGPALSQADRALAETLEHHAHVRLRRVTGA